MRFARLRSRSCVIDGEAVACDDNGVPSFDLVRHHRHNDRVFLYAFDLIELNGDDMRRDPLEVRKATLASIVAKATPGIRFNEHIEGDGPERTEMSTLRTHFTFRVDTWTPDGESIVEHVAGVEVLAASTFRPDVPQEQT
jgi:hypothetical protein